MRRNAFTLIEMMIAISLFAVVMIFLYQAMATVDKSNRFYTKRLEEITTQQSLYKTIYLDLALSQPTATQIESISKEVDMVFIQTAHVVHTHVMPYVVYFVKDKHLYRVESANKLTYPFESNINAIVDDFGPVVKFRVYKNSTHFLLHININGKDDNLMKIRQLNAL